MYNQYQGIAQPLTEKEQREAAERNQAMQDMVSSLPKMPRKMPVTLVEHMTDPRAAQLQMLYATLDESGRRAAVALLIALVKLQKEK